MIFKEYRSNKRKILSVFLFLGILVNFLFYVVSQDWSDITGIVQLFTINSIPVHDEKFPLIWVVIHLASAFIAYYFIFLKFLKFDPYIKISGHRKNFYFYIWGETLLCQFCLVLLFFIPCMIMNTNQMSLILLMAKLFESLSLFSMILFLFIFLFSHGIGVFLSVLLISIAGIYPNIFPCGFSLSLVDAINEKNPLIIGLIEVFFTFVVGYFIYIKKNIR